MTRPKELGVFSNNASLALSRVAILRDLVTQSGANHRGMRPAATVPAAITDNPLMTHFGLKLSKCG
ncbi:hypothetical protein RRF57_001477 [Xylaria bambusicola]|uniref:Uncharacterized protein n=1 Tax=Xylaria bambusicola TaxID=326684 RepID=A0AAN7Z651_9PEZI